MVEQPPLLVSQQHAATQQMAGCLRPAVPADGVIAMQAAEQHAPSLRACALKGRHCPAEIGRIAHGPIERDKKSLKLFEIIARIGVHIVDVDIAGLLPDRFDIWRLVGITSVRHRPIEIAPGDPGESSKPLILFAESARGKNGDRRRVRARR